MNGFFNIDKEGEKIPLLFGMKAVLMIQELTTNETIRLNKDKKEGEEIETISPSLSLAFLVYAGMCNYAEFKREPYPNYEESYEVTDFLMFDQNQQSSMWDAFKQSRAGSAMLEKFANKGEDNGLKKKKPTKRKPTQ